MAERSAIEWTDSTWNPWEGCTKVGPGCDHCYAEARNARFGGGKSGNWGPGAPRKRLSAHNWKEPLQWNAQAFYQCPACGTRCAGQTGGDLCPKCSTITAMQPARRRVFCASLADWLDNEVPIEWLADLLDTIKQTPNLDWLLLTKRIGNWRGRLQQAWVNSQQRFGHSADLTRWIGVWLFDRWAPANVWLGATVVNQTEADRDVPKLLSVPARVRFLSMEPLLGPVVLQHGSALPPIGGGPCVNLARPWESPPRPIDWIIAGGESGHHARPSHPDWFRSLRDQCKAAGVPFLFKQWGEWVPGDQGAPTAHVKPRPRNAFAWPDLNVSWRAGKKAAGRLLDGVEHNGFPVVANG